MGMRRFIYPETVKEQGLRCTGWWRKLSWDPDQWINPSSCIQTVIQTTIRFPISDGVTNRRICGTLFRTALIEVLRRPTARRATNMPRKTHYEHVTALEDVENATD